MKPVPEPSKSERARPAPIVILICMSAKTAAIMIALPTTNAQKIKPNGYVKKRRGITATTLNQTQFPLRKVIEQQAPEAHSIVFSKTDFFSHNLTMLGVDAAAGTIESQELIERRHSAERFQ